MTKDRQREVTLSRRAASKICRWCGGPLVYEPNFPVLRLVPGEPQTGGDDLIPQTLRTLPAWVCGTPYCKYREKA